MENKFSHIVPRIVVLISAYNAEKTVQKTLTSLQKNQEPHDIVIVDDGSTVPLDSYITPQPNLTIIRAPKNVGLSLARNLGLEHILAHSYEYVACLDADDIAAPQRLAHQRDFLDRNQNIGLLGSWGHFVSEEGKTVFHLNPPQEHDAIITKLFYNNCFLHPSLMIRADLFRNYGNYSNDYPSAEDYEIIRRFALHTKVANIPEYLLDYTISMTGISQTKRREQLCSRLRLQWVYKNFYSVHFYLGILKTFVLSIMPYALITKIKTMKKDYHPQ